MEENQNSRIRTEQKLPNVEYLIMFIKLIFRQSNIVCIGISCFLIVKPIVLLFLVVVIATVMMCFLKCLPTKVSISEVGSLFIWLLDICYSYQWKLLTCFVIFSEEQQLIRCFIQDLTLDIHSYLDIFLHGSSSSFDNHWWYQKHYHALLVVSEALPCVIGPKICIFSLVYLLKINAWIWYLQSDLLEWTGRTLKRIKYLLGLFLKYGRKILTEEHF